MDDKVSAGASGTVKFSETFASASVVLDIVTTVAAFVNVVRNQAADVEGTARAIVDTKKCVSILGAVFQAVAITARCILVISEAS